MKNLKENKDIERIKFNEFFKRYKILRRQINDCQDFNKLEDFYKNIEDFNKNISDDLGWCMLSNFLLEDITNKKLKMINYKTEYKNIKIIKNDN